MEKDYKKNYKLSKVLSATIVDDDVLKDTLLLRDENTGKVYTFDAFRKSVSNKYGDEMMLAVADNKQVEFFNEQQLREFIKDNHVDVCRVNFLHA